MANPGSKLGQIGESFEQIGKDVARETVQAPKDITGKALESLGMSSSTKNPKKQQNNPMQIPGQEAVPQTPAEAQSEEMKRAVAHAALEEISGKNKSQQKEPGVWEKLQKEEEEKKEREKQQKELAAKQALPQGTSKRPRGDLYGVKAKKTNVENKGKRQD